MRKLQGFYKEAKQSLQMAFICLGTTMADFISSLGIKPPSEEANPFARHADGSFWPRHALINLSVVTGEFALLSAMIYVASHSLGWRVRRFLAAAPWLFLAYEHLEAFVWNVQMGWLHLYQTTAQDFLRRMMGQ